VESSAPIYVQDSGDGETENGIPKLGEKTENID